MFWTNLYFKLLDKLRLLGHTVVWNCIVMRNMSNIRGQLTQNREISQSTQKILGFFTIKNYINYNSNFECCLAYFFLHSLCKNIIIYKRCEDDMSNCVVTKGCHLSKYNFIIRIYLNLIYLKGKDLIFFAVSRYIKFYYNYF